MTPEQIQAIANELAPCIDVFNMGDKLRGYYKQARPLAETCKGQKIEAVKAYLADITKEVSCQAQSKP